MKILILTDWNPLSGGAERYALELREALIEAGDEVRLVTANVSPESERAADETARAWDHPLAKSVLQIHNPFAAATVRRVVRDFRPDVALVNMFALYLSPSSVQALGNVPHVLLISDYKCICPLGHRLLPDRSVCHLPVGIACLRQGCLSAPHWLREQLRYRRIGAVLNSAAEIVATSDALGEMLAEQNIRSRRIHLFSKPPGTLEGSPAPTPRFVYLGRLDEEKGVDLLLHAFGRCRASVPNCELRIVGRGAQQPELERLSASLGLAPFVRFRGWQGREGIDEELGAAWALVAPSRWPEPFGLVALEAIFRGVPAVVPDFGGLAETVDHGLTGLRYSPGDAGALADALVRIATGEAFARRRLEPGAVAHAAERFSVKRHVAQLREVLLENARFTSVGTV